MKLIDSSIWIDYFNGRITLQTDYLHQALGKEEILVGDIILAEVLQGFVSDRDFALAREALARFPQVQMLDPALAVQSARNYHFLRKRGITVRKTINCLIATFVIAQDLILPHNDRDFDPFERYLGLRVLQP